MLNTNENTHILVPLRFMPLPLGSVRPSGWLHNQLRLQADGLTGHLDEFWPSIADSKWIGGQSEGWERGPYWLDGLVPLAVLIGDARLMAKAQKWVDYILEHQHEDGWLGPKEDAHEGTGETDLDPWPQFVLFKALNQWQEATDDERVVPVLLRASRRIQTLLEEKPLRSWGKMRWADLAISLGWLYEKTGEEWLLQLVEKLHEQGYDWETRFADFPCKEKTDPGYLSTLSHDDALPLHGVNNAMGAKSGAVWFRHTGKAENAENSLRAVRVLDEYHGQATGMFSGDEHLAGRNPMQGTETCTVTEYLYSLEQMIAVTGEPFLADKMEQIAYNALPAALTKDMWARQYDQQPNQVLCSVARRDWVSNGPHSNLFSLEGNFGCCTANLHQGWPKLVASLWMQSEDGLAAVAYGPCEVQTEIGGVPITITETTEYPFRGEICFSISTWVPAAFTLRLRIPAWADGATVTVSGEDSQSAQAGAFFVLSRLWQEGDTIVLRLPLLLRRETRFNGAMSLLRGPLLMALRIGERLEPVGGEPPHADWAVYPTTPWNVGLYLGDDGEAWPVRDAPVSPVPFGADAPPVVVTAPAYRLPHWTMVNDSAPSLLPEQFGPSGSGASAETVELVPYGSTLLRVSEFPFQHKNK